MTFDDLSRPPHVTFTYGNGLLFVVSLSLITVRGPPKPVGSIRAVPLSVQVLKNPEHGRKTGECDSLQVVSHLCRKKNACPAACIHVVAGAPVEAQHITILIISQHDIELAAGNRATRPGKNSEMNRSPVRRSLAMPVGDSRPPATRVPGPVASLNWSTLPGESREKVSTELEHKVVARSKN